MGNKKKKKFPKWAYNLADLMVSVCSGFGYWFGMLFFIALHESELTGTHMTISAIFGFAFMVATMFYLRKPRE